MADYDEDVTGKEGYGSVYDYIEAKYRNEWSELDVKSGILVDWGLVAANRWEQFESTYRSNYADYSADYTSDAEFQSRMARKYQEMQEYYQIYEIPAEEQVDVFSDMDIQNAVREEMERDAMEKASDSAALAAFETIGENVIQMDYEARRTESEKALETSIESKNSRTNRELVDALKEKAEGNPEYLVRGAPLRCRYGSHMRYLDMLEAHGVYLNDDPVMHRKDCKVGENILPFGICTSPVHNLKKRDSFFAGAETDQEGNYLHAPDDRVITGFVCEPEIADDGWKNCKKETKIAQDATPVAKGKDACICYEAITTASYLVCKHGGIIVPLGSGQLKFSTYTAPFLNYPFVDLNGKKKELDEKDQKAFENWCDLHNIPPDYPGTEKYMEWYQNRIRKLEEEGASAKKLRAAYEECLDNAYWHGLDHMGPEERRSVRNMVSQYARSGLLEDEELGEMRKRYSGLRLDCGYNSQKNLAGATPEEDEFYQYYTGKAETFEQEQKELEAQMRQASHMEDSDAVIAVANKIRELKNEKEQTYGYFSREVERYSDCLDAERKRHVQEVENLFKEQGVSQ